MSEKQESQAESDDLEQARLLLQADAERRREVCAKEIEAVLKKHGFILRVTEPQIILVEKPNT